MAQRRLSFRVESQREGSWESAGVFDDYALARAQAGQFADSQGNKGVRVVAESSDGSYRELLYDPAQGIDSAPGKGGDGNSTAAGAGAPAAKEAAAPAQLSRAQVLTAMAVLSVGALFVALVLILIFDPLG